MKRWDFLCGKNASTLLPTSFCKSSAPIGSLEQLLPASTSSKEKWNSSFNAIDGRFFNHLPSCFLKRAYKISVQGHFSFAAVQVTFTFRPNLYNDFWSSCHHHRLTVCYGYICSEDTWIKMHMKNRHTFVSCIANRRRAEISLQWFLWFQSINASNLGLARFISKPNLK